MKSSRISILGVAVDNLNRRELQQRLARILGGKEPAQLVTPNPEFMLLAQENQEFSNVLREAALAVPDGIGLKFATWIKGKNLHRHPGAGLVAGLLNYAETKGLRVAVLNWRRGLSSDEDIRRAVLQRHPKLELLVESAERDDKHYNLTKLKTFRPTLLFVAWGAPWQDIFIYDHLKDFPGLRLGMGVGGSFDFLTRRRPRAPRLMQALGLEWLWRLLIQPSRVKRIWKAFPVFAVRAFFWELRQFRYRPNVAAIIVNRFGETLILNARGRGDYWGLPQGGVEKGESFEAAVLREIYEETNLKDLRVVKQFANIYKYTWSRPYDRYGYKGQKQSLFVLRYFGPRQAVKINLSEHKAHRWVKIEDLLHKASPVHRKQYQLFLEKYRSIK